MLSFIYFFYKALSSSLPEPFLFAFSNLCPCFVCWCNTSIMLAWPFHYACQRLLWTQHYYPPCFLLLAQSLQWHESPHSRCQKPTGISWFLYWFLFLVSFTSAIFPVINLRLFFHRPQSILIFPRLLYFFLPPFYCFQEQVEQDISRSKLERRYLRMFCEVLQHLNL